METLDLSFETWDTLENFDTFKTWDTLENFDTFKTWDTFETWRYCRGWDLKKESQQMQYLLWPRFEQNFVRKFKAKR